MTIETLSNQKCFSGELLRVRHTSKQLDCPIIFSIYIPPQAKEEKLPVVYWLSGLTCTDENFMQKAGAQRIAAELGLIIVCPDTSPRGTEFPGEHDAYDFGSGAGFYVDATEQPWFQNYRMYSYVTQELPDLIESNFPVNGNKSISGHSMGGHGALICALKNPGLYQSVSAFSPIVNPMACPWGQKAFTHYLGEDQAAWQAYDSVALIKSIVANSGTYQPLMVDQGVADEFLSNQLLTDNLSDICRENDYPLSLRMLAGYDHSYYFISSFIEDHLRYHAVQLNID